MSNNKKPPINRKIFIETNKNNSFRFYKKGTKKKDNRSKINRKITKKKSRNETLKRDIDFFNNIFDFDGKPNNDIKPNQNNELIKIIPINSSFSSGKNKSIPPQLKILDMLLNPKGKIEETTFSESESDDESINEEDEYDEIDCKISSITDLINIAKKYKNSKKTLAFNINKLYKLVSPMEELNSIIGMSEVKDQVINQIIYSLQNLDKDKSMMHTVITGPPGVGKTMLGYILAKIYFKMGIIKTKKGQKHINPLTGKKEEFKFNIVRRSDLIGEYVGHTAMKTQKVINDSLGGVLFIDEAYSLGNEEKKDTYSKECIDTLNQNLSENKDKILVIIAGYKDSLEKCFFAYNPGLKRRFSFRYNIENYTHLELLNIFKKKVDDIKWSLDSGINETELEKFFKDNYKSFEHFGGDIEVLLLCTKISHSMRIFGKHPKNRKRINLEDIKKGFKMFVSSREKKEDIKYLNMYV